MLKHHPMTGEKIAKVLSRSIKAASLGACAPIGCVTKINAYVMPKVTIKNTIAKTDPMRNISRALMSSWLNRSLFLEAIAY
jgi:hypothetical protein